MSQSATAPAPQQQLVSFLGVLCLFSLASDVPDEPLPVTRDQFLAWFDELGLQPGFMPAQARGVEAFRAATSNLTDEWTSKDIRYKVEVREAQRTDDYVKRQLWATWRTDEGPQQRRVADLTFYRPRRVTAGRIHGTEKFETMMHKGLEDLDQKRLRALVNRCKAQYQAHMTRISAHNARAVIRAYLLYLGAVSLRTGSGGAYFLPLAQLDEIRKLRTLVSRCGPQCRLMFTPTIDDPEQREMLRDAVELDIEARAQSLLRDIDEWVRRNPGKTPTALMARSWEEERGILQDLLIEYGDLLEETFAGAADRLEELREAIQEVATGLIASKLRGE